METEAGASTKIPSLSCRMSDAKSDGRLRLRVPIIATLLVCVLIGARGVLERKPVNHAPEPEHPRGRSLLPFSATDVTNYFVSVLDKQPVRAPGGAIVFEESKAAKPEHRYRVVILKEHNDLVITFSVVGDSGMNLAREFFEAPLFKPNETQRLYAMVDHAQGAPTERLHRFTITMRMLAYPKDRRLTVRLSP
jgi:hypothetical protein